MAMNAARLLIVGSILSVATSAVAQESLSGAPGATSRPGWIFTPSFGVGQTYDDNVTLFATGDASEANNDLITTYTPRADLTYVARRTQVTGGYGGTFLNYRTFSLFDRWDQRAQADLRRTENSRIEWSLHGSVTARPSTEALDFDGLPYSHTGAVALDARGTVGYRLGVRDSIGGSLQLQRVEFDRPGELREYLRGGRSMDALGSYQRRVNRRAAIGTSYAHRRATVQGSFEQLLFHMVRGSIDYELSPTWSLAASGGLDYIEPTLLAPSQRGLGLNASANRSRGGTHFTVNYQRSFLPSFGQGGAILSQEVGAGFRSQLFRSRHFYTDHGLVFRDTTPLIELQGLLKLRTVRTSSIVGWMPYPWMHVEGYYSYVQQTSLLPGGLMKRNRIGFRIVTSRPVRVQ
jgi:hypothetical protein